MKRSDWLTNNLKKTLGKAHRVSQLSPKALKDYAPVDTNGLGRIALNDSSRRTIETTMRIQREANERRRIEAAQRMRRNSQIMNGQAGDVSTATWRRRYLERMAAERGPEPSDNPIRDFDFDEGRPNRAGAYRRPDPF